MTDSARAGVAARASGPPFIRTSFPASGPNGTFDHVALVTIDRQDALNALSFDLLDQLVVALESLDGDPACRAIVLMGAGERAFAAGADVRELASQTPIAAVRGFALGGGCELAMTCDMIVAGEDAQFGQPEIRLGVMPGAGGTQRLTRAIGKAKAMEMILTGRTMAAREAEANGLVTRVVPTEATLDAALDLASVVAAQAPLAVLAAKQAILQAAELSLSAGLDHERRAFFQLFGTDDQTEGMTAFGEKRPASWTGS